MVEYRTLKTPEDGEDALIAMQDFMGMLAEYWMRHGQEVFGKPLKLESKQFADAWAYGSLVIMMAYEGKQPVGFLLGIRNRAITHDQKLLMVEKWYGRTPEIEEGMLKFLYGRLNELQVTEVAVPDIPGSRYVPLANASEERSFTYHYYRWKD